MTSSSSRTLEDVVCDFMLQSFERHSQKGNSTPLRLALTGPQGSGKSYLAKAVKSRLSHLNIVFLSLDDLYLSHDGLRNLKVTHCNNALLDGRGLPGTHDVELGRRVLQELSDINSQGDGKTIHLPIYDKSKFAGLGDRSTETRPVNGPVDIVVFEGWCVGFYPLPNDVLEQVYEEGRIPNSVAVLKSKPYEGLDQPFFKRHSLESLKDINEYLKGYAEELWCYLDALVRLVPEDMAYTYDWRIQQEHTMKERNGGKGMTDEQVRAFVTRYMPGYELFGSLEKQSLDGKPAPWQQGNTLHVEINKSRQPISQQES